MDDTKNEAPVKQMTAQEKAAADYIGAILEKCEDPRAAEIQHVQGGPKSSDIAFYKPR